MNAYANSAHFDDSQSTIPSTFRNISTVGEILLVFTTFQRRADGVSCPTSLHRHLLQLSDYSERSQVSFANFFLERIHTRNLSQ